MYKRIFESEKAEKSITVKCYGDESYRSCMKILQYLQTCGEVGHSCTLEDTNGDGHISTFDGDGNSRIVVSNECS